MAQLKDLLVNGSARVIGSLFANLSGNVLNFGVCSTAAATAAKTVTTNGTFELIIGSKILVLFSETDSSNAPTLNVNGTGAKNIKINASDGIGKGFLAAQQYYWFIYDGTNWRTAGAGITQIIPTQYGGTGNSSFTANRIIYSNTATKLASGTVTTDGAYLGNISYLSVNNDHQTGYRLYVNGTSYLNGQTTVYGPLRVGRDDAAANTGYATANVGANNYIAFYGLYDDNPGGYNHTYIGESIYGPKDTANEKSELLLFHGNDPDAGCGPDRIRLFAGEIDIQVYTSALAGTWDTIRATTGTQIANFKNGMSTFSTSVTVGTSTSGALGIAQTDGVGRGISLYNGPATAGIPEYGIAFAKTATFGTHGAVTSDWATYFTMSDTTTRGWIFRRGSTNVASIDGTGKLYLGYAASAANPGIYWNPYVESASDGSDVSAIYQIKSGVAGGTELRISQANDSGDVINIVSPYYIYLNSKRAFTINDSWLRINENVEFSGGIYTGSSLVRTNNQFQVGDNGNKFYANSSGNGYFSNTLGIAGTNTSYKLYINGTSYFNGNATFNGHVLPNTTNTYDLGSSSLNWKKLFLSDIIYNYPGARIAGGGNFWYCTIITINTNAQYINNPIVLEVSGRGIPFTLLQIHFQNSSNVDPELLHFTTNCSNRFYIKKTNTNQWTVYCQYTETWGSLYVHRITGNGASRATISLANVKSLPADCIQVSSDFVINGNLIKKLTIQANGTQKGQFNNSADVTVNLGNVAQDFTGSNSGNPNNINTDTFAGMTRQQWLNTVYPIGSIYMSVNSTSPETLFGGTWESLGGRFLIGQDGTYSAGSTGGSATHTHTIAHTHTMAHTHDISHTHTMAHTHTLSHTHTTPATTTGGTAISVAQMPSHQHSRSVIVYNFGSASELARNDSNGDSLLAQDNKGSGMAAPFCIKSLGNDNATGGGGAHTHSQVATTTNSQNTATTSAASNATTSAASTSTSGGASNATTSAASNANSGSASALPPYLAVYMWKRTA